MIECEFDKITTCSQITPDAIKKDLERMPVQTDFDFDKLLIDLSSDIKEPPQLISLADKPLFSRGNISCISGRAKSRKTFLVCLLASQFLECEDKGNVMIFDTEQGLFHAQKAIKRIHRQLEWEENTNNKRLRAFFLRELTTEKRLEFVRNAIGHYKPDLVFIDGVRDLMNDFNSISESSDIVNLLMNLSSENNNHICVVLHENKVDNNLRGHAGTEIQNKSETVISVETDGDISEVTPKYCRNIDFDKFHFKINDDGLPEMCEPEIKPKNRDKLVSLFTELLPAAVTLSYSDLRDRVMNASGKSKQTAERYIKEVVETGVIVKNSVGLYYSSLNNINVNNIENDNHLSF